jgi:hypothetical protein
MPATLANPARPASDASRATASEPRTRWYGWQTLLVDGAALALILTRTPEPGLLSSGIAAGHYRGEFPIMNPGLAMFLLGPPVLHAMHGNWQHGLASAVMRVSAPVLLSSGGALVGGFAGLILGDPHGTDEWLTDLGMGVLVGGTLGLLTGYLAAVVGDAVIARKRVTDEPRRMEKQARLGSAPAVAPMLAVDRRGAALGLVGRF